MDEQTKKKALRMITNGMYILASAAGSKIACSTVTWLSQKSFKPPLVAVNVKKDSFTHAVIQESKVFSVHILGKSQKPMAEKFFKHAEPVGNTIAGCKFHPGKTGSPIFDDCPAHFECNVVETCGLGDHTTFIGEVIEAAVHRDEAPLAVSDTPWSYGG